MAEDQTLQYDPRVLLERKAFITPDDLARSDLDALYTGDASRYINIAKLTIQKFLEACLREDGQFHTFFTRFASFAGNFVVNENFSKDERRRMIQIVRFFEDAKERPPQIFIQDGGYSYKHASLGGLTAGWNERTADGQQIVRVMDSVDIPMQITCAALDETTIEDLQGFLSLAFGQMQRFLGGWILRPSKIIEGAYWEVQLPLTFEVGAKSFANFHGDPTRRICSFTFNFTPTFENSTYITYNQKPAFDMATKRFEIVVPTKITLGSVVPITLKNIPSPITIYSNNSKIALIRQQATTYFIIPKRLGKFKMVVAKPTTEGEREQLVYGEQEMEVVLR